MAGEVQELAAELTDYAARTLVALIRATPEDQLRWMPLDSGRSILEQIVEVGIANRRWARVISTRQWYSFPPDVFQEALTACRDTEAAVQAVEASAGELIAVIKSVPDSDLRISIESDWGPYSMPRCLTHAYWNMVYHEGQINYVQTLYGDFEEHEPE